MIKFNISKKLINLSKVYASVFFDAAPLWLIPLNQVLNFKSALTLSVRSC